MKTKHALITGGAGFIGSHLADALLARGFEVTVLDALLPQVHADGELDAEGWPVYLNRKVHRIRGSAGDAKVFAGALRSITHVAHLAASVGVGQSMTNVVDYTRNNVMTAAVMLEVLARKRHTVERLAVASSMSIYGEGEYVDASGERRPAEVRTRAQLRDKQWDPVYQGERLKPIPTHESKPLEPGSIYAINKRDHEEMFLTMGRALHIPTIALRLFNAYGSRQALSNPYTGVAAIFISRLLNDQPPLIFEDGEQKRDFVHVGDVANAFATVLDSDKPVWDVFNVGSGDAISIRQIAQLLGGMLHKDIAPTILNESRVGDVRHCFADISKLQRTFGLAAPRKFRAGAEELIEWVRRAKKPVDRGSASLRELRERGLVV